MGHTMGILLFRNKVKFDDMKKELNCAQVKDWKMECESALAGEQLHGLFEGNEDHNTLQKMELYPRLCEWMPFMCNGFAKHVMRHFLHFLGRV